MIESRQKLNKGHLVVERPQGPFKGEVNLLGDKSIAHRAIILSALAHGQTTIENFPTNKDCLYTIEVFKKLGVNIKQSLPGSCVITVIGKGLFGLKKPACRPLYVGASGTTLRLLLGVLSGCEFVSTLTTDKSLSRRPMLRVDVPLRMMGARITARVRISNGKREEYPPICVQGGGLKPITYKLPVASAQVKSAILLAGLYADGITRVIEPVGTRDHTERMLKLFKADIKIQKKTVSVKGGGKLISPKKIYVPGDISSASFFIVLALIHPGSEILIKNVSLNPSRCGIISVLKRMGADIRITLKSPGKGDAAALKFEPMGDILARASTLNGTIIKKHEIPLLIDELPILMVAASLAKGKTTFAGVQELRVKETDRINSMLVNLRRMQADIRVKKARDSENIIIKGVKHLKGAQVRSFGDHRTAMSMVVAGICATGKTSVDDVRCINKSFPGFLQTLKKIV